MSEPNFERLKNKTTVKEIPETATEFEKAESTEPGLIRDLFLADEETKHKNGLEKIYYEIVHRGGV